MRDVYDKGNIDKDSVSNQDGSKTLDHVLTESKKSVDVCHANIEIEESKQSECDSDTIRENVPDLVLHGIWPPQLYEYIAVKTNETWRLGEVIREDEVLMQLFKKLNIDGYEGYSLWQDDDDERVVSRSSILPIRSSSELIPSLCLFSRYRRRIIVQNDCTSLKLE